MHLFEGQKLRIEAKILLLKNVGMVGPDTGSCFFYTSALTDFSENLTGSTFFRKVNVMHQDTYVFF